ncbi:ribose ABC transporter permease [Thermobispora bispora]|jgi:simple sugar transport system permease protein|uniref:Inner-membrane translocator n=1 Tax=Thermobispora bispora (strain ATCC 19993 / DSM 43833 / CBS 139.67 / JCM 10125 / KCTC 9307 / NBRC 14880 / R51) TaxID=469371 RepID=D6Y591_THEBD|nr:ABC transporter permease [Thermobispora bispora]MBO2473634.1 ABC transporter permease [Actinomycetales bacterium]MDI9580905.1 ABC transporter permease [Thermobispora sp.]ADG89286.1 inner-membrane translocator [Thermobispora bispora DSM 43833]MBX6167201.1 ABC transporter permease [Thermobispora bispora]QSI48956.1 ABC transporter permease [Thermobispora bispora]
MSTPTTVPASERIVTTRSARLRAFIGRHIQVIAIAAVLVVLVVFFSATADRFMTVGNILNLLRQIAPTLIVAVAMTFVITTAGIDLSVGSIVALTGSLLAILIDTGVDPSLSFLAVLALGALVGAVNGWFSSYQGLPPFIVTLATLSIIRGTALRVTEGYSTPIKDGGWVLQLGQGRLLGVPIPAILAVVIAAAGWFALTSTPFGRYVTGLGSNAESLRRSGVEIRRIGLIVYVLTGLAAALAGVLVATRLASGSSNAGVGFELEVITAVVLGGTSLFGGRGSMLGTILGALTLGVISNGLVLLHVSPFYVQIVQGSILLLAIFGNTKLWSRFGTAKR